MDKLKLNCLCASENQVLDESEVEDFDERSQKSMTSSHFDGFEQEDEDEFDSILCKDSDTFLIQNSSSTMTISYQSEHDDDLRERCGCKRVNSMDSQVSSADTCTTVSLSQSFMHDDDDEEEDEVYSTVTTEVVKNLQVPFRAKGSNHEHKWFRYLLRMKPDNYIREDDTCDDLSVEHAQEKGLSSLYYSIMD